MARQISSGKKHDTGRTITTPSPYGTHKSMIVENDEVVEKFLEQHTDLVAAKDDNGYYLTYKNRVDSGLADPNRFDYQTRNKFSQSLLEITNG